MKISLSCNCGATYTAEGDTYINLGGRPNPNGMVFALELRAEAWMDRHESCRRINPPLLGCSFMRNAGSNA